MTDTPAVDFSVLDALAWSQISQAAMVRKLSSKLAKELEREQSVRTFVPRVSKARVESYVRATKPPRGSTAKVIEEVRLETERQLKIRFEREKPRRAFRLWLDHRTAIDGRLDYVYASAFARPVFARQHERTNPHPPSDAAAHHEWEKKKDSIDWGENCVDLMLWRRTATSNTLVVLIHRNYGSGPEIRVRRRDGSVTISALREHRFTGAARTIPEALVALADDKVRHAWKHGIRVEPDYENRLFVVHGEAGVTTHPWLIAVERAVKNQHISQASGMDFFQSRSFGAVAAGNEEILEEQQVAQAEGLVIVEAPSA